MAVFTVTEGVYGIDVELFDSAVASVYCFDDEEPTLVDAGVAATADELLDGLEACGVSPADLSNVVCSHIHVDHTGAASALVDAAPDCDVHIHESTAPYLENPEGLIESSRQAMGDHFDSMGEQGPVPEANIVPVGDEGTTLEIGANSLELIHAPGHSPDHLAVWNPERDLLFAAECLGLHFERADQWLPPATLPNFDVDAIDDAIERLEALEPDRIVFPHYGEWPGDPEDAFETARTELHRYDERILAFHENADSLEETKRAVAEELLELSPPYDPVVESFFARLVTEGYLRHHGLA